MAGDLPLLGFGLPVSGRWATPATIRRTARRAEDRGYASLWTFQRMLNPASDGLGPSHESVLDPVVPLAFVAGHTDRIRLGTATICAPFIAPALLAKSLASLDVLSAGRLTVGVGIGWMVEEYVAAGVTPERRGARMDEYLRCLKALWTEDPVEFAGEFYTVPRSHMAPLPVQRPHPPVLVGASAAPALRRAGRLGEGWICSTQQDLGSLGVAIETVRGGAREAGRDPNAVQILVRGVVDLVDDDPGVLRRPLHGTREQVLGDLAGLRAQGVTEVFFDLNHSPRVNAPDVDTGAALAYAEQVLDTFAPVSTAP